MASSSGSIPPNTTLYIKNISSKIKKPEIKRQLYCLFITYGKILDVVATKIGSMKGQAFVVFMDLASSTAALRAMDGFIFYDKPLVSFFFISFYDKLMLILGVVSERRLCTE
jgi:U2 small nuclear ribonucleoprotein B''